MPIERGSTLLALARGAIAARLGLTAPPIEDAEWLHEAGSTFVTLRLEGALRGCVGSLWRQRELREDVEANACAAAFLDSRFPPLTREEYPRLGVGVTLLSPLEPLDVTDEAGLLDALSPGVDGLVLHYRQHRSTFLPAVWEQLAEPRAFLDHLLQKAGLPAGFWDGSLRFHRFTATSWQNAETAMPSR